jgi:hypothetical protein
MMEARLHESVEDWRLWRSLEHGAEGVTNGAEVRVTDAAGVTHAVEDVAEVTDAAGVAVGWR